MGRQINDPFNLLRRMEQRTGSTPPGLPEETQSVILWSGVGFKLADISLVTPLDHISEILPCPPATPVFGVKRWVKGIANVRGNLLTIIDLPEYFGKEKVYIDEKARLLVINIKGLNAALIVNEVLGLRHFDEELESHELEASDDPMTKHLQRAFMRDGVQWGVLDMYSLANGLAFKHVTA